MRSLFALSGLFVLIVASFSTPAWAEEATVADSAAEDDAGLASNDTKEASTTQEEVTYEGASSDECRTLSDAAHERIREFLESQRADVEDLLARHEAEHGAYHENHNVSAEDDAAFHERQEHEWADLKARQSPELDRFTVEAWQAYREGCEKPYADSSTSAPNDLPGECRERWAELEGLMREAGRKWEARHQEFQADFDAARAEFRNSDHSDADWKAFEEKWAAQARELFQLMEVDMREAADTAGLAQCWLAFHHHAEKPIPSYADRPEKRELAMDEGVRRIMERCESQLAKLRAEYESRQYSSVERTDYESEPAGDGRVYETNPEPAEASPAVVREPEPRTASQPAAGGDFKARYLKIQAACEAEMKAYMEKKHSEGRDGFGSFVMREEDGKILVEGKFLSMVGLPERQMMTEIALNDKVLIDALFANGYLAEFRPEQTEHGSAIMVFDASGRQVLGVHDNPRGVIKLSTTPEIDSLTLDLHDELELSEDGDGIRFAYGDWKGAVLVHKGSIEIGDNNVLTLRGKATFLVTNVFRDEERLGDKYNDAVLDKKVGAEVAIAKDGSADATPLTDIEVKAIQVVGRKLSANFDAPDGEGKTVVFNVEVGLFKCDGLAVRLYSVNEDGSESSLEIREADDLEDVLDPADDGPDGFEYWCVSDKDGQQILVSIAHFSEKRVEVESEALSGLPNIPGFELAILVAAAGVGVVAVGARRRK